MKVAVLNYPGVVPTSVSGPFDMLTMTESVAQAFGIACRLVFEVDIVNASPRLSKQPFQVVGNRPMNGEKIYDLVIVPAMGLDAIEKTLKNETRAITWIKEQYKAGSDIASICLGSFLLGRAGLLDGRKATCHWMAVPLFKNMFPEVKLESDKVIVDEQRVYTTAAAYSFTSLMIYLIEKFCGRDLALAISRVLMIQVHDTPQDAFSIFQLQHAHESPGIGKAQAFIEKNFGKKLLVREIADRCNLSQRTFIRKFTLVTGNTPLEYIQRVRIESAKRMLEKGELNIDQVCSGCGYEDINSFRSLFKKHTGLSPREYKNRYSNMFNRMIVG